MRETRTYFFAGIGGIGMSALALHLHGQGQRVYGFDRQRSRVSNRLEQAGISITFSDNPEDLPDEVKSAVDLQLVYTPALHKEHRLLKYFREKGTPEKKRSELLQEVSSTFNCWAVAGTHGKTTTSAILSHLLIELGQSPTSFLGGILLSEGSNYIQGNGEICVVEADEFDRSFLRLRPHSAIITSNEPDHLDIYGDEASFKAAFQQFRQLVQGPCIVHTDTGLEGISYGGSQSHHRIQNLQIKDGIYRFDWHGRGFVQPVEMRYPGRHNLENALAAMALCAENGFDPSQIANALSSFGGVWRRFENHSSHPDHLYYDDYAHHPGELRALIASLREWHPDRPLSLVFQPHLFSRTRDFMEDFAHELSQVDELFLLPIYPAREMPIDGVDSEALLNLCQARRQSVCSPEELLEKLDTHRPELLVTAGAGDIDKLVDPIAKIMKR